MPAPEQPDPASFLVHAVLPLGAQFGPEQFIGDPVAEQFCTWLARELNVRPRIFASWCCPPTPFILSYGPTPILVRSERFDTLLVEFVRLKAFVLGSSDELAARALKATVFRWVAEFCLGQKLPVAGMQAAIASYHYSDARLVFSPFRDEMLASVDVVSRVALQCCNLAHEFAHINQDHIVDDTLSASLDDMTMLEHVAANLREEVRSPEQVDMMLPLAQRIDAKVLLREVDADLRALEYVGIFLLNNFDVTPAQAIELGLTAIEAQSFLNAALFSCSQLAVRSDNEVEQERILLDWLNSAQIGIRARCVMRRAGFLLARWSEPATPSTVSKVNRFVPLVDSMFAASAPFRVDLSYVFDDCLRHLRAARTPEYAGNTESDYQGLIEEMTSHPELKQDLHRMMIGMGYSGAVDPWALLTEFYSSRIRDGLPL